MIARITAEERAARRQAEADRLAEVKARGHVPREAQGEIPEAPARGAVRLFEPVQRVSDGQGGWRARPAGHLGRKALREADVFDRMGVQARRQHRAHPLTESQIAMARYYRDLTERQAAAGIHGQGFDGLGRVDGGGGGNGGYLEALLRDQRRLSLLQARIGTEVSLKVRRVRPSARGTRVNIPDRQLVDGICLGDRTVDAVLTGAGWATSGRTRQSCYAALSEALERMMGPVRGQVLQAAHFGDGPRSIWAA